MDQKPSREELKRRLRNKISEKRGDVPSIAKNMKKDPQTAMMSMGIDDPELLKLAPSLLKNPQTALQNLKQQLSTVGGVKLEKKQEDDEEEEAPPCV
jgi:hypothetical protein